MPSARLPGLRRDDRDAELESGPHALRPGGAAIGKDQRVDIGKEFRHVGRGDIAIAELDAVGDTELMAQSGNCLGAAPELAGDPEPYVRRSFRQCPNEHVETLVRAHETEEQHPAVLARRRCALDESVGHERRHRRDHHGPRREWASQLGLGRRVHDHAVGSTQQRRDERPVQPAPLVRQHVVADHRRPRVAAAQRGEHRPVGRHLDRRDVREHDQIAVAEPSSLAHPGVRSVPRQ